MGHVEIALPSAESTAEKSHADRGRENHRRRSPPAEPAPRLPGKGGNGRNACGDNEVAGVAGNVLIVARARRWELAAGGGD